MIVGLTILDSAAVADGVARLRGMNGLATTSTFDETNTHGIVRRDQRDSERTFRRAARHSRRVRVLRVALPAAIVLTLSVTIFVIWLDPLRLLVQLPGDPGKVVVSGTRITMQAPKITGYTRDQRAYDVTANGATQDLTKPNIVELQVVRAKVETADKSMIYITSKDGIFDRKDSVLTLTRDVRLTTVSGSELRLDEAIVNTVSGAVVSNKPVKGFTDKSTITADRLEVVNSGEIIRFIDNVVVDIVEMGQAGPPAAGKK